MSLYVFTKNSPKELIVYKDGFSPQLWNFRQGLFLPQVGFATLSTAYYPSLRDEALT